MEPLLAQAHTYSTWRPVWKRRRELWLSRGAFIVHSVSVCVCVYVRGILGVIVVFGVTVFVVVEVYTFQYHSQNTPTLVHP